MRLSLLTGAAVIALTLGLPGHAAQAQSSEPGSGGLVTNTGSSGVGDLLIGEIERRILQDYFQRSLNDWRNQQATLGDEDGGEGGEAGEAGEGKKKKEGKNKKRKGFPPGLAKRGELPPGLSKQLVRNGQLPPGLAYRDLPDGLRNQLPGLPPGYRYGLVDNKVLLIQAATNTILDVLEVAAAEILN
jgi:hypothetical protein